jgi:hypothetical protein
MNIDTGRIVLADEMTTMRGAAAALARLEPVDLGQATEKQKAEMQVSLKDHTSVLGKQLTKARQWRSKYTPHVGRKEAARRAP